MWYKLLADLVVLIHLGFILFVTLGGLLVLRWRKLIWLHLPLTAWGIIVEYLNFLCPLTPLENHFRRLAGLDIYQGDFIGEYILPLIYPEELTRSMQIMLGSVVVLINILIYGFILYQYQRKKKLH